MEASAIPASVGLARSRITIGASLLRIRTDEQLVNLFREGNDEAFRVIHDRYRARMLAYTRQMLGHSGQDPEDAVQEIFMRAYHGLRANHRHLALRAWLYRIAHNRCIDDLRRPPALAIGTPEATASGVQDPAVRVEQRDALRRLIADVRRLPDQQRSALLMRELSGMSYSEVSGALGVSVPAVKSLLVRARVGLAQASTARNTACAEIQADLVLAHDRGVRTSGLARRHLRECQGCREFRTEVRGVRRQLAALSPTLGPLGVIAHLLGWGGGGTSAAAGSGAVAGGTAVGGGAAAAGSVAAAGGSAAAAGATSGLLASGAGHVVTLLAAAVVTAGGAVEIQSTLTPSTRHAQIRHFVAPGPRTPASASGGGGVARAGTGSSAAGIAGGTKGSLGGTGRAAAGSGTAAAEGATGTGAGARKLPITMVLDPDMWSPNQPPVPAPTGSGSASATGSPGTTPGATTTTPGTTGQTGPASGTGTTPSSTTPTSTPPAPGTVGNTGSGSSTGSGPAPTSPPATSSGSTANPGASPASAGTTNPGSVGRSTSSASRSSVISFIAKRRRFRHRFLRDKLLTR